MARLAMFTYMPFSARDSHEQLMPGYYMLFRVYKGLSASKLVSWNPGTMPNCPPFFFKYSIQE